MKFEPNKLSKIIEENYSHLMPDFFKMQTEYLASLNIIYHDLDASLVGMVLSSELYKNMIKNDYDKNNISLKNFYTRNNLQSPLSNFKIKEIASLLNVPRETVRRKRVKLIKDKLIVLDKKTRTYSLNTNMIKKNVIDVQIENLSRFLSKFSIFFSRNRFFIKEVTTKQIIQDVEDKFLIYFINFLDFQISYFSNLKKLMDIESAFIVMLCTLNTTSSLKNTHDPISSKDLFNNIHSLNKSPGLNATSIAEITKVPRTTVLRKIAVLEKTGWLKKDKFKRYASNNLINVDEPKKIMLINDHNIKLLGIFFSKCLDTYTGKNIT